MKMETYILLASSKQLLQEAGCCIHTHINIQTEFIHNKYTHRYHFENSKEANKYMRLRQTNHELCANFGQIT